MKDVFGATANNYIQMRTWVVYGKKRSQTPHVNVALVIIVLILRIYAKSLLPVYFSPLLRRSLKRCAPAEPPSPRLQCPLVGELSAPALQHLEDWEKPQILSTAFIPGTALLQVGKIHLDYCQSVCRGGKKKRFINRKFGRRLADSALLN